MSSDSSQPPTHATPVVPGRRVLMGIVVDPAAAATTAGQPLKVAFSARRFVDRVLFTHSFDDEKKVWKSEPVRVPPGPNGEPGRFATERVTESFHTWEETLPQTKRPLPKDATLALEWVANIGGAVRTETTQALVSYTVTIGTETIASEEEMLLLVGPIKVTQKPSLRRVMLHEFARPLAAGERDPFRPGNTWTFDEQRLVDVVDRLTPQQRDFLLGYPIVDARPRLVGFVTLRRQQDWLEMGADFCFAKPGQPRVLANASLSLFRCDGKRVILAFHTDYLVVNVVNDNTRAFVEQRLKGKLSRSDPKMGWPKHAIGCVQPFDHPDEHSNQYGVMWHRVFSVGRTGFATDVMPGNFFHEQINTVGCWMLHRNNNWHVPRYDEASQVFRDVLRVKGGTLEKTYDALVAAGYVPSGSDQNGVMLKFNQRDSNFAHAWFSHDVLGLRYNGDDRDINDHEPHGNVQLPTFPATATFDGKQVPVRKGASFDPYAELERWLPTGPLFDQDEDARERILKRSAEPEPNDEREHVLRAGETKAMNAYSTSDPSAGRVVQVRDDLWTTNAFGDQVQKRFCIFKGDLNPAAYRESTWADLYFVGDDVVAAGNGINDHVRAFRKPVEDFRKNPTPKPPS